MRSHPFDMRVAILMLVMPCCCAMPSFAGEVASLGNVIRGLKASALDATALRQLGGTSGFKEYPENPVLKPGLPGSWDAGALGSMTILKVDNLYHLYYEAWGVRGDSAADYNTLQTGHAVSLDGIHWSKDPANPVLPKGGPSDWDRDGTWDPFVIYEGGLFKLWYGGGMDAHCDWGYAQSADGRTFIKKGQISHLGNVEDDHVVHDPVSHRYHMYHWDRRQEPKGLFRATGLDEKSFDFAGATPITIAGESPGMYKFSHVVVERGVWYMFYGDFLRPHCPISTVRLATSTDGVQWTSVNKHLMAGHDGELLRAGEGVYLLYYGPQGHFDARNCDVRVAVYAGKLEGLIEERKKGISPITGLENKKKP